MRIEHLYGHDNELLMERYTFLHVREVLVNRYVVEELLFDDPPPPRLIRPIRVDDD